MEKIKICKKCIIPDSFPNVTFENGICSLCRNYKHFSQNNKTVLGKDKLLEILTTKKTSKYNCVIPLSGGKDSSYILFYVVEELGLKPLAVFFDSSFVTDIAKRNIEKICKKLSVDLVIVKSKSNFRRKLVKEGLYIFKFSKGRFLVICGNCENNLRTSAINEATKRKIPFIIWGSTDFEDSPAIFSNLGPLTFRENFGRIGTVKKMKKGFKGLLDMLRLRITLINKCKLIFHSLRYIYYRVRDNIDMGVSEGWKKLNPFLEVSFECKNVEAMYFYDYIKYDPYKYVEILKREIGWEAPFGKESRMDCKLHCVINYRYLKSTGITGDGFYLSGLIRNSLLTRRESMEKEEILKKDSIRECQRLFKELGVNVRL